MGCGCEKERVTRHLRKVKERRSKKATAVASAEPVRQLTDVELRKGIYAEPPMTEMQRKQLEHMRWLETRGNKK